MIRQSLNEEILNEIRDAQMNRFYTLSKKYGHALHFRHYVSNQLMAVNAEIFNYRKSGDPGNLESAGKIITDVDIVLDLFENNSRFRLAEKSIDGFLPRNSFSSSTDYWDNYAVRCKEAALNFKQN